MVSNFSYVFKHAQGAIAELGGTFSALKSLRTQIENVQDVMCDCYCKFPEEYYAMYKDVDEADENLRREKCEMCPLEGLL